MEDELRKRLTEFAWNLGQSAGFVSFVLGNEEALLEFAARGVKRTELMELLEASKRVAEIFYNEAKPV